MTIPRPAKNTALSTEIATIETMKLVIQEGGRARGPAPGGDVAMEPGGVFGAVVGHRESSLTCGAMAACGRGFEPCPGR